MKRMLLFATIFIWVIGCKKSSNTLPTNPPVVDTLPTPTGTTFTNPLLLSGPDPWVIKKDSFYYYTHTLGNSIALWRTTKMSNLKDAQKITVWTAPAISEYNNDVWAPELHFINNKWYLYFAADNGNNASHRIYVLENITADPLSDNWTFKGKVADTAADKWAIDASEFEFNGQLYLIWSGWAGDTDGRQDIYIAPMSNPWTISGARVLLALPVFDWEKVGGPTYVNEGPEAITNSAGNLFITFSASGCWTDNYCLGLLTLKTGGNPLAAMDWTKTKTPVFGTLESSGTYGPGHNGFFKSADGTQDWIIYHANNLKGQGCGAARNPRIQQFTWNNDGSPNFGTPLHINTPTKKPSGE